MNGARPLIFVVEDDLGIATLEREMLEDIDCDVVQAATGRDVLELLATHKPVLMLLDYSLPDMTGIELLDGIAARGMRVPPFMVTTGGGDEYVAVDMMRRGALNYLVKDHEFLKLLPIAVGNSLAQIQLKQRLWEAESKLRLSAQVIEATNEGLFVTNGALCIIDVNPACERILGYERDELIGCQLQTLLTGHSGEPTTVETILATLKTLSRWQGEVALQRKSGEVFTVWFNIAGIKVEDGSEPLFVTLFSDISLLHVAQKTYGLILAGGRGTRLYQLTDERSKPAVPFGGQFKIIDFALSNCVNSGIRRVGVLTQYKAQSLIRHIERGWGFLEPTLKEYIDVVPAQQQVSSGWYSGTADAAYQNLALLDEANPAYVLILAGDHIYKMDYTRMLADHVNSGADLTLACIELPIQDVSGFGVMAVDGNGRVTAFEEKPKNPVSIPSNPGFALASMGIYVFNAVFLREQLRQDATDAHSSHDFGRDLIPRLIHSHHVQAHRFADSCVNMIQGRPYWRDVGTVEAYWEANMDLTHVVPDLNLYDNDWPILSVHDRSAPAKFVLRERGLQGMALDSVVSNGCIISGATVCGSVLFTNVRVAEYSHIDDSVLLPGVLVGRNVILKRAVVDSGCIIPDGLQVGVNPDADRVRFHVTERGITLITPEMLGQNPQRMV